jgi:hypothetical protein
MLEPFLEILIFLEINIKTNRYFEKLVKVNKILKPVRFTAITMDMIRLIMGPKNTAKSMISIDIDKYKTFPSAIIFS